MVLTASDGTVAEKPPMIGSDRVIEPPSARTRSTTVVSDACHCWTMILTGGGGGGGGGSRRAPDGPAPATSIERTVTRPTTSRRSLIPPRFPTVRFLQRAKRECALKVAGW